MTKREILSLKPGEELDRLVAIHVFGEPEPPIDPNVDAFGAQFSGDPITSGKAWVLGTTGYDHGDEPKWYPHGFSISISAAWKVVEYVSYLVCPFEMTDGSFDVLRLDWGEHCRTRNVAMPDKDLKIVCSLERLNEEARETAEDAGQQDPEPWSAHFHVGLIGDGCGAPSHWKHGDVFCAYGGTAQEAICKSALMAMIHE